MSCRAKVGAALCACPVVQCTATALGLDSLPSFARRLSEVPAELVCRLDSMLGNRLHKVLGRSFLLLLSKKKLCPLLRSAAVYRHCRLLLRLWARGDVGELLICVSSYWSQVVQVPPHLRATNGEERSHCDEVVKI